MALEFNSIKFRDALMIGKSSKMLIIHFYFVNISQNSIFYLIWGCLEILLISSISAATPSTCSSFRDVLFPAVGRYDWVILF